jgi:HEPN domain-containing protein
MRSDPKREAERWSGQAEQEWNNARFLLESGRFLSRALSCPTHAREKKHHA